MDYRSIYLKLIEKRKIDIPEWYREEHHILPRSLGGTDEKDNLVYLTAREHFIAHLLLVKIYKNTDVESYRKMVYAFYMLLVCKSKAQKRYVSSREFAELREEVARLRSIQQTGEGNSQFGTIWMFHEIVGAKKVRNELIEEYIFQGWVKGKYYKFCKTKKVKSSPVDLISKLTDWYRLYSEVGFKQFCDITGYDKSKQNLVQMFNRYVKEYIPQNGKVRGK